MSILEDEEAQKRGVVGIMYKIGASASDDGQLLWRLARLRRIIPINFKAFHVCHNHKLLGNMPSLILSAMGKDGRLRFRAHYGASQIRPFRSRLFHIPVSCMSPMFSSLQGHTWSANIS